MKRRSSATIANPERSSISKLAESIQNPPPVVSQRIPSSVWWVLFSEILFGFTYFQVMQDYLDEEYLAVMGKTNDETEWQLSLWIMPSRSIGVIFALVADVLQVKRLVVASVVFVAFVKSLLNAVNSTHFDYGLHCLCLLSVQGIQAAVLLDQDPRKDAKLISMYCLLRLVAFNFGCVMQILIYFLNTHFGTFDHGVIVSFFNIMTLALIFFTYIIFVKQRAQHSRKISLGNMRKKHSSRLTNIGSPLLAEEDVRISSFPVTFSVGKRLLYLLPLAFPTVVCGYAFIAYILTFGVVIRRVVAPAPNGSPIELLWLWRPLSTIVILLLTEGVVVPFIRRRNVKLTFRFRLGFSLVLWLAGHIAGMKVVSDLETSLPPLPRHWSAQARFVNFQDFNVTISSINGLTSLTVGPNEDHLVSFANLRDEYELRTMKIESQAANYVTHVSVEKGQCVTYAVTDYSELYRISGHDPIHKGPPGTNFPYLARCYLANLDRGGPVTMTVLRWGSGWTKEVMAMPGKKEIFQLEPGYYTLSFDRSNNRQDVRVFPNSVQGIIYLSSSLKDFDTVRLVLIIPPVNLPIFFYAALSVLLLTFSSVILMVELEAILGAKSPETFRSFTYSVYFFVREPVIYGILCIIRLFYNEREDMFVAFLHGMLYLMMSITSLYITTTKFGRYWAV
ncbi:unnamed protein product [Nesidiocoris tenuis]|uniref:Uncharacterized protein n=1 Tax=Nesidiocoris tenuis TaxID=355587 RepID=A0A6H5H4A6_9HEMI|nr:unnamed protein product [Nesidiocoris tenuis]